MKQPIHKVYTSIARRFGASTRLLRHLSMTKVFLFTAVLFVVAATATAAVRKNTTPNTDIPNIQTHRAPVTEPAPIIDSTGATDMMDYEDTEASGTTEDSQEDTPDVTNRSNTTVTVNGESVTVPQGSSYERSYSTQTDNGNTHVDISIENHSSSGSSASNSSVRSQSRGRTSLDVRTESSTSSTQ
jgi:hypothetical protein